MLTDPFGQLSSCATYIDRSTRTGEGVGKFISSNRLLSLAQLILAMFFMIQMDDCESFYHFICCLFMSFINEIAACIIFRIGVRGQ